MARRLRVAAGGVVYHVLNRAVGRNRIFDDEGDYLAFEKVLLQAHERIGLPVCREEPSAGRIINQGRGLALVKRCGWGIAERKPWLTPRDQWPVPAPSDWTRWVDLPGNQKELEALRRSVTRGAPSAKTAGCGGRQAAAPGIEPREIRTGQREGRKVAIRTRDPLHPATPLKIQSHLRTPLACGVTAKTFHGQ